MQSVTAFCHPNSALRVSISARKWPRRVESLRLMTMKRRPAEEAALAMLRATSRLSSIASRAGRLLELVRMKKTGLRSNSALRASTGQAVRIGMSWTVWQPVGSSSITMSVESARAKASRIAGRRSAIQGGGRLRIGFGVGQPHTKFSSVSSLVPLVLLVRRKKSKKNICQRARLVMTHCYRVS